MEIWLIRVKRVHNASSQTSINTLANSNTQAQFDRLHALVLSCVPRLTLESVPAYLALELDAVSS